MIKHTIHKMISIGMALLVMLSTLSITVEKHFCGDFLIDVSVFSEADKCGAEMMPSETKEIQKKSCCKDTIDLVEGQDELLLNSVLEDGQHQDLIVAFIYAFSGFYDYLPKQQIPNYNYEPPDLVFDIQVLGEVFII